MFIQQDAKKRCPSEAKRNQRGMNSNFLVLYLLLIYIYLIIKYKYNELVSWSDVVIYFLILYIN